MSRKARIIFIAPAVKWCFLAYSNQLRHEPSEIRLRDREINARVWNEWKNWAAALKQNTYALYLAARDPRVPRVAKLLIVLVVAYALSPIDLIPDFIPVLGYLDDMLLLPMGIALAIKLMPRDVWEDCKHQSQAALSSELPRNRTAAIVIATVWLALLGLVGWLAFSFLLYAGGIFGGLVRGGSGPV
jgi:uncharacterized membrane protein YkvA (DUF1232 family)